MLRRQTEQVRTISARITFISKPLPHLCSKPQDLYYFLLNCGMEAKQAMKADKCLDDCRLS